LRVAMGERDLDEACGCIGFRDLAGREDGRQGPARASLDQAFKVNRALLVLVEAVLQGMVQIVQAEVLGAAAIGTVQEWTMVGASAHTPGAPTNKASAVSGFHRQGTVASVRFSSHRP